MDKGFFVYLYTVLMVVSLVFVSIPTQLSLLAPGPQLVMGLIA